jgi:hypothetical protein
MPKVMRWRFSTIWPQAFIFIPRLQHSDHWHCTIESPTISVYFYPYFVDPTGKSPTSWFPFSIPILTPSESTPFLRWFLSGRRWWCGLRRTAWCQHDSGLWSSGDLRLRGKDRKGK